MKKKAFQADVIFIGNQDFIANGIIELNEEGVITHLGENASSSAIDIDKLDGTISPGFVNTHCHLELSHLKNKVSEGNKLHGFVQELQQVREAEEHEVLQSIKYADVEMRKNGIVAVGDISNGDSSFKPKTNSEIFYHTFVELFGFDKSKAQAIYERGKDLKSLAKNNNLNASIVPHSPYSVSDILMEQIGRTSNNSPISIHNQETEGENKMFQNGNGTMIEMLTHFGLDLSEFNPNGNNSIFNYLPFLNKEVNTLLVHNTFTAKEDIEWAERLHQHLFWCFCPNANQYIENRLPNIPQFIEANVNCTLGTDSLASNWQLSIWSEIEMIQKVYPQIKTEILLEMACLNGAKFLGVEDRFGKLEIGRKPGVNWIKKGIVNVLD